MYTQKKNLKIKVCHLKIGIFLPDNWDDNITKDIVGIHMDKKQAEKYVAKNYGSGHILLDVTNGIECVTLDIVKLYNDHMEGKNNE